MAKRQVHRTPGKPLQAILYGLDGKWVAIRNGEVVAANETPYGLVAELRSRQITDASIIRAPAVGEPEMVAFG
jgi:hypothetical protein